MTDTPGQCCPRCSRWLPAAAYDPDPELRTGSRAWCSDCVKRAKGLLPRIEVAVKDLRPGRLIQ